MLFRVTIEGQEPGVLMQCGFRAFDDESPEAKERSIIAKRKGSNKTEADIKRLKSLDCYQAMWLNDKGSVTIPARVLRAMIQAGARRFKEGTACRGGLFITDDAEFTHSLSNVESDPKKLADMKEIQYSVPVVIQRAKVVKTRAQFKDWKASFIVDVDDDDVDRERLIRWLDIAGRKIGIGDWRPEKSGVHGRFAVTEVEEVL